MMFQKTFSSHSGNAFFNGIFKDEGDMSPVVPTVSTNDSNTVAMTRYQVAVIRSKIFRASLWEAVAAL